MPSLARILPPSRKASSRSADSGTFSSRPARALTGQSNGQQNSFNISFQIIPDNILDLGRYPHLVRQLLSPIAQIGFRPDTSQRPSWFVIVTSRRAPSIFGAATSAVRVVWSMNINSTTVWALAVAVEVP